MTLRRLCPERLRRARHAVWAAAALAAMPFGAAAQEADVDPFHWAYAPLFGSGVYRLSDGTQTKVLRAPFSVRLRDAPASEGGRPGLRVLLPVTIGIQNLDDAELPPERPTDRAEYLGFTPGIEIEHAPGERLTLRTAAYLGAAAELQAGEKNKALVAAVGMRSRLIWKNGPGRPALINGVLWAGFDPEDGERRSLLRLTTAVEFRVPVPRWRFRDEPMHLQPHVLRDWFYRPPDALAFGSEESEELEREWQLGLAAGREQGFKIWFFEFDSVGVAYRYSEHSEGIRFYLNSVF